MSLSYMMGGGGATDGYYGGRGYSVRSSSTRRGGASAPRDDGFSSFRHRGVSSPAVRVVFRRVQPPGSGKGKERSGDRLTVERVVPTLARYRDLKALALDALPGAHEVDFPLLGQELKDMSPPSASPGSEEAAEDSSALNMVINADKVVLVTLPGGEEWEVTASVRDPFSYGCSCAIL